MCTPPPIFGPLTEVDAEEGTEAGIVELSAGMQILVSRDKRKRSEGAH